MTGLATQTISTQASRRSLGNWMFALAGESPHRLIFTLPWKRVVACGLALGVFGAAMLHPMFVDAIHPYLRYFGAATSIVLGLVLAGIATASDGELTIDGLGRVVRFRLQTPWRHVSWIKPFDEFEHVQYHEVVDRSGLHNHWQIELLMKGGSAIRLGYGLLGAIRWSAADHLIKRVAHLMDLPIRQLPAR